jgi:hypothetical protein
LVNEVCSDDLISNFKKEHIDNQGRTKPLLPGFSYGTAAHFIAEKYGLIQC